MVTLGLTTVRLAGRRSQGATDRTVLEALPPGELARREPHEPFLGLLAPTSLRFHLHPVDALRLVDVDDLTRPLPDGWARVGIEATSG